MRADFSYIKCTNLKSDPKHIHPKKPDHIKEPVVAESRLLEDLDYFDDE